MLNMPSEDRLILIFPTSRLPPRQAICRWGILISRYINIAHLGYNTIFKHVWRHHTFRMVQTQSLILFSFHFWDQFNTFKKGCPVNHFTLCINRVKVVKIDTWFFQRCYVNKYRTRVRSLPYVVSQSLCALGEFCQTNSNQLHSLHLNGFSPVCFLIL